MFNTQIKVRFNHVDAAGLVFYPRYYEMFNQVIEEWFERHIQVDFNRLHIEFGAGVPVVSSQANFPNPTRLGDVLEFDLIVDHVGSSSIALTLNASVDDQPRVAAKLVLIYVQRNQDGSIDSMTIPDTIRAPICTT